MKRLDENLGGMAYDNLLNSNFPNADVFTVSVKPGQGVLPRGAVLALSSGTSGNGQMALLGEAAAENEVLTANAILSDPVDTGDDASAAAPFALAYRTGHFNMPALIVKEGYTITDADKEELRKAGILISDAI